MKWLDRLLSKPADVMSEQPKSDIKLTYLKMLLSLIEDVGVYRDRFIDPNYDKSTVTRLFNVTEELLTPIPKLSPVKRVEHFHTKEVINFTPVEHFKAGCLALMYEVEHSDFKPWLKETFGDDEMLVLLTVAESDLLRALKQCVRQDSPHVFYEYKYAEQSARFVKKFVRYTDVLFSLIHLSTRRLTDAGTKIYPKQI